MIPFYENRTGDLQVKRLNHLDFLPHLHSQLELMYVEGGRIEATVNDCTRLLAAGDLSVSFPNVVHSYRTPGEQTGLGLVMVIIDTPLLGDYINTLLKFHPRMPFIATEYLHSDVPYAMKTLSDEYDRAPDQPAHSPICKAYAQIIISRLLQQLDLEENSDADYYNLIYKLIHYINENFRQPLSLETLARAVGVSKYHISRTFSDKIKISFSDYLNGIRAGWARNMLLGSGKKITQIAYDCGFQSTRTFNRAFLKEYGVSPRKFRSIEEGTALTQRLSEER